MGRDPARRRFRLEITWGSIFRILAAVLLAYAAFRLWPLFKLLSLSILLAVALYPIVTWSVRRGWPRWVGLLLASMTLLVGIGAIFGLIGPIVYRQTASLAENLPKLQEELLERVSASPFLKRVADGAMSAGPIGEPSEYLKRGLQLGKATVGGIFDLLVIVVFAIYFVVDGPRTIQWLVVFFPQAERGKIHLALQEAGELVSAYVVGQAITSGLCAAFVWLVLTILHVPMALLLGVLAGVFDVLPIIGFFLSVLPAVAVGLTVSVKTAVLVFAFHVAYNLVENYFIVPKVYGDKLKLSNLAVLLAITVAALLAGVTGAIVVLPLVAAYPVFERLWLARRLPPDAVAEHARNHVEGADASARGPAG